MPQSKEEVRAYKRQYYLAHKAQSKTQRRRWYLAHKRETAECNRRWREANPDRAKAAALKCKRVWEANNVERIRTYWREAARRKYADPKRMAKHLQRVARWTSAHKDELRAWARAYEKRKRRSDIWYRVSRNLRARVCSSIRGAGAKKSARFAALVGCSPSELMAHLQAQFLPGMTWKNYGPRGWHIDHILECVRFDLQDPAQQRACFHYTNLRPLWAEVNIRRSQHLRRAKIVATGLDTKSAEPGIIAVDPQSAR